MRVASGKGNDARKVLSYYSVNFNLSPPYKILCDGPTIFQSLKNNLYLKQSLPKLLGATAYPVVTNCVVSELKSLGEDFSNAALFAKRAMHVPCTHEEEQIGASDCIVTRLKQRKELQLLLATNDVEVLARLSRVVGVPLITVVNQTKLMLKPPSRATLEYVEEKQQFKGVVTNAQDQALIEKVQAEELEKLPGRYQIKQIKKRKRAKGPNPLSVKKPKTVKKANTIQNEESSGKQIHGTSWNEKIMDTPEGTRRDSSGIDGVDDDAVDLGKKKEKSIVASQTCNGKMKRRRKRVRKKSETQAQADFMLADSNLKSERGVVMDTKDHDLSLSDRSEGRQDNGSFVKGMGQHRAKGTKQELPLRAESDVAKDKTKDTGKEQKSASAEPNGKVQFRAPEDSWYDMQPKDSLRESSDAANQEIRNQDITAPKQESAPVTKKLEVGMRSGDDQDVEEFGANCENNDSAGLETSQLKTKKQRKNRRRRPKKLKET